MDQSITVKAKIMLSNHRLSRAGRKVTLTTERPEDQEVMERPLDVTADSVLIPRTWADYGEVPRGNMGECTVTYESASEK